MERITPVAVTVKLHPQVNAQLEDHLKRINEQSSTPYTKQRFTEEAIREKLARKWKTL